MYVRTSKPWMKHAYLTSPSPSKLLNRRGKMFLLRAAQIREKP